MKAAYIEQTGPPENIVYGERAHARRPGRARSWSRSARSPSIRSTRTSEPAGSPWPLPMPYIVGCDLAGTVEAVGQRRVAIQARRSRLGLQPGTAGPAGHVRRVRRGRRERGSIRTPDGVDDQQAAAIALVGITAHLGLFHKARLKSRRDTLRPRRHRRRRRVRRPDGPRRRRPGGHHRRQRREGRAVPRARRRSGDQLQDRRRRRRPSAASRPRASTSGSSCCTNTISSGSSLTWPCAGGSS